jgi:succinyl-CoA synthetase alpha subunit
MAILVDNDTRLVVQGITGREGKFHTGRMVQSGTTWSRASRRVGRPGVRGRARVQHDGGGGRGDRGER